MPSLHLSFAKPNLERTLHFSHQEYLNRIDRTVEGLLVIKRLRSPFGKRSGKMTKKEMDEILPKLKRTTLPSSVQQRLADLAKEINTTVGPLRNQYNSLRNQYASSTNGLKPIESEFFQWMLGKPKYVIESLEALGTYAKRIADLPNSKTNYNQLLVITELIRISKIRLSHITFEELKAQDNLLKRATQAHYNDLQSMLQELEWSDIRHK